MKRVQGGASFSAPNGAPSSRNCTPTTATLSVASAEMSIVVLRLRRMIEPFTAGAIITQVGGIGSFATVTGTLAVVVMFPAVSRPRADTTCGPSITVVVFHDTL